MGVPARTSLAPPPPASSLKGRPRGSHSAPDVVIPRTSTDAVTAQAALSIDAASRPDLFTIARGQHAIRTRLGWESGKHPPPAPPPQIHGSGSVVGPRHNPPTMDETSPFPCPACGELMAWDRSSTDPDAIHALRADGRAYWVYEERPADWRTEPAPVGEDFWDQVDLRCRRCSCVARKRLNYMQKVFQWIRERRERGEDLRQVLTAAGISEAEWKELRWYALSSRAEGLDPEPAISDEQIQRLASEMGVTVGWLLDDYKTWPPDFRPPSLRD